MEETAPQVPAKPLASRQSENVIELVTALAKAQGAFPPIPKNQKSDFVDKKGNRRVYKYADLADINSAITPSLAVNGLSITGQMIPKGELLYLFTRLYHSSGQWLETSYSVLRSENPQAEGSAITYARRYSISYLLNISAMEDDDGEAAKDELPSRGNDPRDHIDQRPAHQRPPQNQRPSPNGQPPKSPPPPQRPPTAPQGKPASSRPAPASPNPVSPSQPTVQEQPAHVPQAPVDSGPDPDDEVTIPATDQIHALKFHGGPFAGTSIRDAWMLRVKAIKYSDEILERIKHDLHANVMENLFLDHGIRNNYIKEE